MTGLFRAVRARSACLALTVSAAILPAAEQAAAQASAASQAHIARVEQNLLPTVRVQGRVYAPKRLPELMREYNVPAVSIAVINDGQIEWVRSYGLADSASQRPATPQTLFQAASISKPVAAMGTLDLVEDKRLALDEAVNAQLVDWKIPQNALTESRPVTLRHLLTHTAGLTVHGFPGYAQGTPLPTVRQILEGTPPANTGPVIVDQSPGQTYRYSGGGFTVLQMLMEDVTGKPFSKLMAKRVLRPLGMTSSSYALVLPNSWRSRIATGYRSDGTPVPGLFHTYPEMAAAGLWTTPSDLARWVIAVQDALAGRSERVLTQAMTAAMLTPGPGNRGLGLEVTAADDALRFSHGGANEGFRAMMIGFARRGQGAVVMTNSDRGREVILPLIQAIAADYGWPGNEPKIITPAKVDPAALRQVVGRYAAPAIVVTVAVTPAADALTFSTSDGDMLELIPQGDDAFVDTTSGALIRFTRDGLRKVTGLEAAGTTLERVP